MLAGYPRVSSTLKYLCSGWLEVQLAIVVAFSFVAFVIMAPIHGAEVAQHNSRKSCWILLDSKVYDVTSFLSKHPGGAAIILKQAGSVRKSQ